MLEDAPLSYPEPRYHGAQGEVTATVRPTETGAEVVYPNGNRVRYLATGASTGGLFGLYRWEMGPEPTGPGPHFHRTLAESFYVLLGTMKVYDGRAWRDCVPGDFVHVGISPVGLIPFPLLYAWVGMMTFRVLPAEGS